MMAQVSVERRVTADFEGIGHVLVLVDERYLVSVTFPNPTLVRFADEPCIPEGTFVLKVHFEQPHKGCLFQLGQDGVDLVICLMKLLYWNASFINLSFDLIRCLMTSKGLLTLY